MSSRSEVNFENYRVERTDDGWTHIKILQNHVFPMLHELLRHFRPFFKKELIGGKTHTFPPYFGVRKSNVHKFEFNEFIHFLPMILEANGLPACKYAIRSMLQIPKLFLQKKLQLNGSKNRFIKNQQMNMQQTNLNILFLDFITIYDNMK